MITMIDRELLWETLVSDIPELLAYCCKIMEEHL